MLIAATWWFVWLYNSNKKVGELVHGDVGIVNITTPDGCSFYSLLKDDFTEFTNANLPRKKSDAATHVIEFCEKIKTQTGNPVKKF
jgi:hypothetical protein